MKYSVQIEGFWEDFLWTTDSRPRYKWLKKASTHYFQVFTTLETFLWNTNCPNLSFIVVLSTNRLIITITLDLLLMWYLLFFTSSKLHTLFLLLMIKGKLSLTFYASKWWLLSFILYMDNILTTVKVFFFWTYRGLMLIYLHYWQLTVMHLHKPTNSSITISIYQALICLH